MAQQDADPREVVALQARILLYYPGECGELRIVRQRSGGLTVEVMYGDPGRRKIHLTGELEHIGPALAALGTRYHRMSSGAPEQQKE